MLLSATRAIELFGRAVPEERIRTDPDALKIFGGDWTRGYKIAPSAIVFPISVTEVSLLVKLAAENRIALVPSGGRTGLSGGAVAEHGEVVVSMSKMNRILDFNPVDRLVRCEAGLVTAELQAFADSKGLFYPVTFASSASSQIGGNIATNAGGVRVIRYGLTRDWVSGLVVVTGTGTVLCCNQGLAKNATGYDFRHLLIGSEGTLGIVVEAEIRLTEKPCPQRVMVMGVPRADHLVQILLEFRNRLTVSAFEFFSEFALQKVVHLRKLSRPFERATPFYALVEYDAADDQFAEEAFASALGQGWTTDAVASQSDRQAAALWKLRESISESIAPQSPYKNDISVKISAVPKLLREITSLVADLDPDFEICWFGHIGDGNVHLNILRPEHVAPAKFNERCRQVALTVFETVQQLGGSISAEHGVGLLKQEFLGYSRSDADIEAMQAIKRVFDPVGILNPNKIFPATEREAASTL